MIAALLIPKNPEEESPPETLPTVSGNIPAGTPTSEAAVPVITTEPESTEESTEDIRVDLNENKEQDESGKNSTPAKKAEEAVKPVKPTAPAKEPDNSGGGIQIGGGDQETTEYSCGVKNHHCNGAETHAYICNMEKEGCPYCGSHACPSFYYVDKWGNAGVNPELCPKYSEKNDPLVYCQKCGKKCGDGTNGTCVEFINACGCPICGKHVEGRTCHTCK